VSLARRGVLHRLAEGLNSLVTQSDGIALSFPGKLDNPFGYPRHRRIIAIYQAQVMQSIFQCNREHRERVWREDFLLASQGDPNVHFDTRVEARAFRLAAKLGMTQ
jgi:hypothetical protein